MSGFFQSLQHITHTRGGKAHLQAAAWVDRRGGNIGCGKRTVWSLSFNKSEVRRNYAVAA